VELEWIRDRGALAVLPLHLFKSVLEVLLEALEIGDWFRLVRLESELSVLLLRRLDQCPCLLLELLLELVLLHPWWQLRQRETNFCIPLDSLFSSILSALNHLLIEWRSDLPRYDTCFEGRRSHSFRDVELAASTNG